MDARLLNEPQPMNLDDVRAIRKFYSNHTTYPYAGTLAFLGDPKPIPALGLSNIGQIASDLRFGDVVVLSSLDNLPPKIADCVYADETLGNVDDMLRPILSLLKPGGVIVQVCYSDPRELYEGHGITTVDFQRGNWLVGIIRRFRGRPNMIRYVGRKTV